MKNKILIGIVIFIALAVAIGLVLFSLGVFNDDETIANNIYNGIETNYNTLNNNEVGNNVTGNQIDTKNASLEELPQSYTIEQAIKDGCFTVTYYTVYNKEYLDNFIENTKHDAQNRVASSIRIVATTVEGNLILYDLSYDGEKYTLKSDYTRDKYMAEEERKVVINDDIPGEFYTVNLIETDGAVELMLLLVVQPSQEYNIINENNDVYITTLDGKKYEDINIVSYPQDATVYPVAPEFRAEVLEVFDNVMWIKPIENGEGLGDKLLINTQGNDFEVGDTVRVIFTGLIRDTYPAQIEVISVEKFEIYNN